MAIDFGRKRIISVVKPGKVERWPRLMARYRVERAGLNMVPWRKAARSAFVVDESMVLHAR